MEPDNRYSDEAFSTWQTLRRTPLSKFNLVLFVTGARVCLCPAPCISIAHSGATSDPHRGARFRCNYLSCLRLNGWKTGGLYRTQVLSSDRMSKLFTAIEDIHGYTIIHIEISRHGRAFESIVVVAIVHRDLRSRAVIHHGAKTTGLSWQTALSASYHALHHAVERRSYSVLAVLVDFVDTKISRSDMNSALILACQLGDSRAVRALLEGGADAAWSRPGKSCLQRDGTPCYALTTAAQSGSFENVALLLQAGANPDFCSPNAACKTNHGSSLKVAMSKLARYPDRESSQAIVTRLLQHGGNLSTDMVDDDESWTGLLPFLSEALDPTPAHLVLLATLRTQVHNEAIPGRITRQFSFDSVGGEDSI